jgi:hypothetical protein
MPEQYRSQALGCKDYLANAGNKRGFAHLFHHIRIKSKAYDKKEYRNSDFGKELYFIMGCEEIEGVRAYNDTGSNITHDERLA